MSKLTSPSFPARSDRPPGQPGFTLVELLVSMTILVVIVLLFAQTVQSTTATITRSTKGMDTGDASSVALDRLGSSISGMVSTGASTLVVIKNPNGSDGLAMITNGRVRNRSATGKTSIADSSDIRFGARGYCVFDTPDPAFSRLVSSDGTRKIPAVPMLNWGDGTLTWSPMDARFAKGSLSQALYAAADDVYQKTQKATADPGMIEFSAVSSGIFRFEVAFLLSNGKIVSASSPPLNKHFTSSGGSSPVVDFKGTNYPVAFNPEDSNDKTNGGPGGRPLFVKALIVGIASLDAVTRQQLGAGRMVALATTAVLPKPSDGKTPLQTWDITDPTASVYGNLQQYPPSTLQNIRFSQRYFYVN